MIIDWESFLLPYQTAVKELVDKFEKTKNESKFSSIEHVEGRVKRVSSILYKLAKKDFTIEEIENKITDIAGIRIVCNFMARIEEVINIVREGNNYDFIIMEEKDYFTNYKASGYRSYHIVVNYPVVTKLGKKIVKVEIQIRPMAMDFWAKIEHAISYKYSGVDVIPEDIKERLTNAEKTAFLLDRELSSIYRDVNLNFKQDNKAIIIEEIQEKIVSINNYNPSLATKYNVMFLSSYTTAEVDELIIFNETLLDEINSIKKLL
jgi:putative GTP pyrophosphokinase